MWVGKTVYEDGQHYNADSYFKGKASGVRLMANAIKLYCIENNVRIAEAEIDNIENVICKSIQGE